ncbi:hypothetical protein [Allostella humosa]|uniref:hypothetical protein n=1 Tax=Stella humosa TaxID=94 RepID=UPI0011547B2B|nr:hypothetical protein [Stella humosa]
MATDPAGQGSKDSVDDGTAAAPLRILSHWPMAAGNKLGVRPGIAVAIEIAPGFVCDPEAVPRLLSALAPDLEDEFRLARIEGPAAPLPRAFAGLLVALLAEGRDLAARVGRLHMEAGLRWYVLVEDGISTRAGSVIGLAAALFGQAIAGGTASPDQVRRLAALCGSATDRLLHGERAMLAVAIEARCPGWRGGRHGGTIGAMGEGREGVRLRHTSTMRMTSLGADMAERKDRTQIRLARAGLPVPRQVRVADAAAACAAALEIGYPVVVKPVDASNARGVSTGLSTPEAVTAAFGLARGHSSSIVVESQLPGEAFRLLVIGGKLVATVLSAPARLVGDGVRTLGELVEAANRIPARQRPRPIQRRIEWTAEILDYLGQRGMGPETVPDAGAIVALHWSGHGGRGGSAIAVTGPVHPDNRRAACQAAEVIGVDVCGIDMVLPDIARSWRETGGGICEVNRAPGMRYHIVADGPDTPVLGRYVDYLLARPGQPDRAMPRTIPILVFVGGDELEQPALACARRLESGGLAVGIATAGSYAAAGLPLADPGIGSPLRLARLVDDPAVAAVVAVVPAAALLADGLGHGRVDLAIFADARPPPAVASLLGRLGAAILSVADLADGRIVADLLARHPAGERYGR